MEYSLCNSPDSVDAVLPALANALAVYVDCEGNDLGTKDGSLSILSLGVLTDALHIFLFDWLVLPAGSKQPLLDLLSQSTLKIVWDGRMDACALFFQHSTRLQPTLDLQLVDIASRSRRGESDDKRLRRLSWRTFPLIEVRKWQLDGVHALSSLDRALKEHNITSVPTKDTQVTTMHEHGDSSVWDQRPLPDILLEYAALDIKRIAALHASFVDNGHLTEANFPLLLDQSARYVSIHYPLGPPSGDDPFRQNGILPLGILSSPAPSHAALRTCTGCTRTLSSDCFPFVLANVRNGTLKGRKDGGRLLQCKVCTFIIKRREYLQATLPEAQGTGQGSSSANASNT